MNSVHLCPICSGETVFIGDRIGKLDGRAFHFRQCSSCFFSYVQNYRTDYDLLYNECYYRGFGADPMVDYVHESENFKETIRNYEWQGILSVFRMLCPAEGAWLDFGCGAGGLVKFAVENGCNAFGYEEGWASDISRACKIPMLDASELSRYPNRFDFISAIEVLEHTPDPIGVLRKICKLLKPMGVLFITTGNARPWRKNLLAWNYTQSPDVHVSFFEPETLSMALKIAGFRPQIFSNMNKGYVDIIKYKILKNLKVKHKNNLIDALPWWAITKFVDSRYQTSKQPYGVKCSD